MYVIIKHPFSVILISNQFLVKFKMIFDFDFKIKMSLAILI